MEVLQRSIVTSNGSYIESIRYPPVMKNKMPLHDPHDIISENIAPDICLSGVKIAIIIYETGTSET